MANTKVIPQRSASSAAGTSADLPEERPGDVWDPEIWRVPSSREPAQTEAWRARACSVTSFWRPGSDHDRPAAAVTLLRGWRHESWKVRPQREAPCAHARAGQTLLLAAQDKGVRGPHRIHSSGDFRRRKLIDDGWIGGPISATAFLCHV